jgi:hypothetical protein
MQDAELARSDSRSIEAVVPDGCPGTIEPGRALTDDQATDSLKFKDQEELMRHLVARASIVAVACSIAAVASASERGLPGMSRFEAPTASRATTPSTLGAPFAGAVFSTSTVLSVTSVSVPVSAELFAPVMTGSREAPAVPLTWVSDRTDSLADRFMATTNRVAGPQDELRPSNFGIRSALNGTTPDQVNAEWAAVQEQLQQRLVDYAFDFGADDLTGAVVDNQRALALLGWNREINAPVLAQGE